MIEKQRRLKYPWDRLESLDETLSKVIELFNELVEVDLELG